MTALKTCFGIKDTVCVHSHPVFQETVTPVGVGRTDKGRHAWPASPGPGGGCRRGPRASSPAQCFPTIHTPGGNQSDVCKHEFINITSILPTFHQLPFLFRIKSQLLTVAGEASDGRPPKALTRPCP